MHTSLDGFVAGPNGEMDWINVEGEIFDYAANRTEEADTALYGRITYQMMDAYWPTAGKKKQNLKLVASREFSSGVVCLHYERSFDKQ